MAKGMCVQTAEHHLQGHRREVEEGELEGASPGPRMPCRMACSELCALSTPRRDSSSSEFVEKCLCPWCAEQSGDGEL